jgi:hypothetical protein
VTFCIGVVVILAGRAGQFDDQSEAGQWDESIAGYGQVLTFVNAVGKRLKINLTALLFPNDGCT